MLPKTSKNIGFGARGLPNLANATVLRLQALKPYTYNGFGVCGLPHLKPYELGALRNPPQVPLGYPYGILRESLRILGDP